VLIISAHNVVVAPHRAVMVLHQLMTAPGTRVAMLPVVACAVWCGWLPRTVHVQCCTVQFKTAWHPTVQ
jgi:hypothetical protein